MSTDTIAALQAATASLNEAATAFHGKADEIDKRIETKEAEVDQFLAEAEPEHRYVQDITIGGSVDYFYPVWWTFSSSGHSGGFISIARAYDWNYDTRPLNADSVHQAGLLLQLEGRDRGWGGDPKFCQIKRFGETYDFLVSHIEHKMYSYYEDTGTNTSVSNEHKLLATNPNYSGVYLRGGGLTYRIQNNWKANAASYSDSQNRVDLVQDDRYGTWYVLPIPIAERIEPVGSLNAYA